MYVRIYVPMGRVPGYNMIHCIYIGARGYMAVVSNTTEGNGTALYLLDVTSSTPLLSTSLSGHYLSHHCSYGSQCVTIVAVDEYGQQILVVSLEDGIWIVMINNYQSARQLYLDSMHTIDTSCATLHIGNSVKQESLLVLCTIGFRLLAYNVQLDALIIRNSLFSAPTELTTLPSHNRSRPVSSIIESQDGTLHFIVEDVHYRVDNLTILMKKVFQNTTARSVQFVVSSRPSEETTTMCTSQLPTTRDITAANSSKTDGVPLIITIIIAALFVFVGPIVCMILFINYR